MDVGMMRLFASYGWDHIQDDDAAVPMIVKALRSGFIEGPGLPAIDTHRQLSQRLYSVPAPPLMSTDFCLCGPSLPETEEQARRYRGKFVESNFQHYELLGEHFAQVQGYDA